MDGIGLGWICRGFWRTMARRKKPAAWTETWAIGCSRAGTKDGYEDVDIPKLEVSIIP